MYTNSAKNNEESVVAKIFLFIDICSHIFLIAFKQYFILPLFILIPTVTLQIDKPKTHGIKFSPNFIYILINSRLHFFNKSK